MRYSVPVSPRSFLIAGMSAAVVGTAAVTPMSAPPPSPAKIAAAVELTSLASGLQGFVAGIDGIFTNLNSFSNGIQTTVDHVLSLPDGVQASIKQAYTSVERWPAYAADWANFSLGLLPGLWWVAPSVPFAYNTAEPLIRAGVYSVADLIGLDPGQFVRDIRDGIQTSSSNARIYAKAWADSFVPVPTLPPYPGPLPSADPDAGLPAASTSEAAAPETANDVTPVQDDAADTAGRADAAAAETTASAEEKAAPADETTAPADETTASANEATAPPDETTAPANETTVPADNSTTTTAEPEAQAPAADGDAETAGVAPAAAEPAKPRRTAHPGRRSPAVTPAKAASSVRSAQ
jgi:hypothetical protein